MKKTGEETELRKSFGFAENQHNKELNTELIERREVPDSPFLAVRSGEEWFLMFGKYRLNKIVHKSYEDVLEDAKNATWDRIIQVIGCIVEFNEEIKKLERLRILFSFSGFFKFGIKNTCANILTGPLLTKF